MRVRTDAAKLSPKTSKELTKALKGLKAKMTTAPDGSPISVYDSFVAIHLGMTRLRKNGQVLAGAARNGGHNNAAFLPWHREYLLRVERELQIVANNPDLSIPYWDWTDGDGTFDKIFVNAFLGGDGTGPQEGPGRKVAASHPFSKNKGWPIDPRVHVFRLHLPDQWGDTLRRALGTRQGLPTREAVEALFDPDKDQYEDFRGALEGGPRLHNAMHEWVAGSMLDMSSPNDPIFMLNHSNIDRLWALWQSYGHAGESNYPDQGEPQGHNLNDPLWPWNGGNSGIETRPDIWDLVPRNTDRVEPAHVLDCRTLGYTYVVWSRVKEILDKAIDAWRQERPNIPPHTSNEDILKIHDDNFGWSSLEKLRDSTALGIRLIEPNKVGNNRGFETNLVRALREGIPGVAPRMPKGGPFLSNLEIAEIAHWIDSGMPE